MVEAPNVVGIDLAHIRSPQWLHQALREKLDFPESYQNTWASFREMADQGYLRATLVLFNLVDFSGRHEGALDELTRFKLDFNKRSSEGIIIYDRISSKTTRENLFGDAPLGFGLRGDPGLWRELESTLRGVAWTSKAQVFEVVTKSIESVLGCSLAAQERVFVERFAQGGMSSGQVSTPFWRRVGIPLLMARFEIVQGA